MKVLTDSGILIDTSQIVLVDIIKGGEKESFFSFDIWLANIQTPVNIKSGYPKYGDGELLMSGDYKKCYTYQNIEAIRNEIIAIIIKKQ
jgi:hypothetical protein